MTMMKVLADLPVVGDLYNHAKNAQTNEVVRDLVRIGAAAVTALALGFFPSVNNYLQNLPYVGAIQNLPFVGALIAKFQLLTPLTRGVILGLASLPAVVMATGVYYVYTAVTIALRAQLVFDVVTGLDVAAKLAAGIMMVTNYRQLNYGLLELDQTVVADKPAVVATAS